MSIITVKSINEIPFDNYTSDDIIAFDLDDTLFIQKDKIMRNANTSQRNMFISDIKNQCGNSRVSFLYDNSEYMLVESDTLNHIENLNKRNVETIAFTARRTGRPTSDCVNTVEDNTLKILNKLGINFRSDIFHDFELEGLNTANLIYANDIADPTLKPFDFPSDAMIKNCVIFANNIDKGIVVGKTFQQFKFVPTTFVLIDDNEKNHQSMILAIKKINDLFGYKINYVGYHYTGAKDLLDNVIDPRILELQKTLLLNSEYRFVSDDEASRIIYGDKKGII